MFLDFVTETFAIGGLVHIYLGFKESFLLIMLMEIFQWCYIDDKDDSDSCDMLRDMDAVG